MIFERVLFIRALTFFIPRIMSFQEELRHERTTSLEYVNFRCLNRTQLFSLSISKNNFDELVFDLINKFRYE